MKKYIKPITENVNVKLFGSVLGGTDVVIGSPGVDSGDAKQTDILWGDDSTSGDLWGDEENVEEF